MAFRFRQSGQEKERALSGLLILWSFRANRVFYLSFLLQKETAEMCYYNNAPGEWERSHFHLPFEAHYFSPLSLPGAPYIAFTEQAESSNAPGFSFAHFKTCRLIMKGEKQSGS